MIIIFIESLIKSFSNSTNPKFFKVVRKVPNFKAFGSDTLFEKMSAADAPESAYLRVIRLGLELLVHDHIRGLFEAETLAVFDVCRSLFTQQHSNPAALHILSRLLQRRSGWIRARTLYTLFDTHFFAGLGVGSPPVSTQVLRTMTHVALQALHHL